jgi:hypothetical protein
VTLSTTRNSRSQPYQTPRLKITGGATGGLGVMMLRAATSAAVAGCFRGNPAGVSAWARVIAPVLSAVLLTVAIVLAIAHYGTLLGTAPGNSAAWLLPSAFGVAAVAGLCWGLYLRGWRPGVYAAIGLGAEASAARSVLTTPGTPS